MNKKEKEKMSDKLSEEYTNFKKYYPKNSLTEQQFKQLRKVFEIDKIDKEFKKIFGKELTE